jgi:RNA polymerase sigma-70 factor (ECF subfamily)
VDVDQTLVAQAVVGSRAAFDELVGRYQVKLYTLTPRDVRRRRRLRQCHAGNFLRAFRAISKFRGDRSFRTWLYRIAINVM